MSVIELGMSWWASDDEVRRLVRIEGLEHLQRATAAGKGAIILSGHFGASEFAGRIMEGHRSELAGLYRPNRNAMVDEFLRRGRSRTVADLIAKDNMRAADPPALAGHIRVVRAGPELPAQLQRARAVLRRARDDQRRADPHRAHQRRSRWCRSSRAGCPMAAATS